MIPVTAGRSVSRSSAGEESRDAASGRNMNSRVSLDLAARWNACIESFNGRFRDECLNEHWFVSMRHARSLIESWRIEYNAERPHSSLGYLTPGQFARAHEAARQFLTSDSNCGPD
jgi:hypothetical protein